jgi:alpha-tubulin suppressor-like RCC1 family protein
VAVPTRGVVRSVVAGALHSLLLLESGEVYGCGWNLQGQLGLGGVQSVSSWYRLAVPGTVREVVAGGYHSFLLLETGEVYACGDNLRGQLGLGDARTGRTTWQRVPVSGVVRTVAAGGESSFLQLATGEVYACGANNHGQLGLGNNRNYNSWRRVVVPGVVRTGMPDKRGCSLQ